MIVGPIDSWKQYVHVESGKKVKVVDPVLQVKTDRHWQTCVQYTVEGDVDSSFAVPVDDFRQRFKETHE